WRSSRLRSSTASSSKESSTAEAPRAEAGAAGGGAAGSRTRAVAMGRAGAGAAGSRSRAWLLVGLVALGVIAADQLTKRAIRGSITPGDEHRLLPGVDLVNTRNRGVAFGF